MSNLVICRSLTKAFGAQTLFEEIDLVVNQGDRIGLIGPNGSGKSTLLKILCGLEDYDSGKVQIAKHAAVGYLAQVDAFDEEVGVADTLYASLADCGFDEVERHNRVDEMLSRAEFVEHDGPVGLLSGGWRKRLAICRALLAEPDVLVLDEPTNHLDMEGIVWLEKLILAGPARGPAAFVMVSHDRQFLENCATRMVELAAIYPQGSLQVDGSYSVFLEKRQASLDQQLEQEDRLSNKVRRETEWLQRGPKARTSKARYRIDEAHRLQGELARVRSRNRSTSKVDIEFGATGRKTKKLLEATKIAKAYGSRALFKDLDIVLSPGSRLGLLGGNGCGKSTLMEVLEAGDRAVGTLLDSGDVTTAENVKIVAFDQKRAALDRSVTLRRALAPEGDSVIFQGRSLHVVSWAKRFLFRADQLETPVEDLSGGEQARILIASLMLRPADILLLDEPTNDLDIGSLDVLEQSLAEFPGALVLVTHDRYLLDRVCDSVLGFDGNGGVVHYADYRQWLAALKKQRAGVGRDAALDRAQPGGRKPQPAAKGTPGQKAGRLSYLDQRQYDGMEAAIEQAEAAQEELERQLADPQTATDPEKLDECWRRLEKVKTEVEALYERWDELEEKRRLSAS
ncbi:MAG: ABC-F family ATP-binding cassette domain-containing protein [Desulfopila sp.]